ncbi:MAG: hypothetical protein JNL45_13250 [Hyphomicrobium sp.]|jgi:hypothetical protein|nr:hypothetical protein [Hyphomicrobium sp.]
MRLIKLLAALSVSVAAAVVPMAQAMELPPNDYPTVTRADYVYGCMQANGATREMLEKCSCSIDQIAALLPFSEYEEAETIKSVSLRGGEQVAVLQNPAIQAKVKKLQFAQVEAELKCF